MKKALLLTLGALAVSAAVVVAQVPTLFITAPVGTETVNAKNAGPQITSVYLSQIRDSRGFAVSSASSGTVTFAVGQSELALTAASTISSVTLALTAAPQNGQMNCFYSKAAITTLTLSATSPATINDALTSNTAAGRHCYIYSTSGTVWNRIQ